MDSEHCQANHAFPPNMDREPNTFKKKTVLYSSLIPSQQVFYSFEMQNYGTGL
jgi:ferritin-like metal-binding protein YciE